MNGRVEQLQKRLRAEHLDAFFVTSDINRRYLTGFSSSAGWLLITKKEAFLLVDSHYIEAARRQVTDCTVVLFSKLYDTLKELIRKLRIRTLAVERSQMSLAQWGTLRKMLEQIEAVDSPLLDTELEQMRAIKSETELADLKEAQRLTELAFDRILPKLRPGMSEREAALEIEFTMRSNGAERVSFDLIVITGAKTSMPHGVPGTETIQTGDFVTMDIGAVYRGMHADMTRTVAIGSVSDEMREVYQTVLQAQQAALEAVHDGVRCGDVDAAARGVIAKAGYGDYFGHSTGHSVGFEVHEAPNFSPNNEAIAHENMVITVEPGIYLPGRFGVRIEDMVRVTKDGHENLTKAPKELILL